MKEPISTLMTRQVCSVAGVIEHRHAPDTVCPHALERIGDVLGSTGDHELGTHDLRDARRG